MREKKQMGKKGVSLLLSYVLLLGMILTISIAVTAWIYMQARNPPMLPEDKCEGVSISAGDISCLDSSLEATLTNTGRFSVDSVVVRADNKERDVLRFTLDSFEFLDKLLPDETEDYSSILAGTITQIKFIPIVDGTYCADQITYTVAC